MSEILRPIPEIVEAGKIRTVQNVAALPLVGEFGWVYIVGGFGEVGGTHIYTWDPNSMTWTNESEPVASKPILTIDMTRYLSSQEYYLYALTRGYANIYSSYSPLIFPYNVTLIAISAQVNSLYPAIWRASVQLVDLTKEVGFQLTDEISKYATVSQSYLAGDRIMFNAQNNDPEPVKLDRLLLVNPTITGFFRKD